MPFIIDRPMVLPMDKKYCETRGCDFFWPRAELLTQLIKNTNVGDEMKQAFEMMMGYLQEYDIKYDSQLDRICFKENKWGDDTSDGVWDRGHELRAKNEHVTEPPF